MKKLLLNATSLTLSQALIYSIQIFVIVYLVTKIELEKYGLVAFSQAFVGASLTLLDLGFSISATNKISIYRNNKKYIGKLIGSIFTIKFILFILSASVVYLTLSYVDNFSEYKVIICLSLLQILVMNFIPSWIFYGTEKVHKFSFVNVISKLIFALSVFLMIKDSNDYFYVPILGALSQIIILAYSFYVIRKKGYFVIWPKNTKFISYTLNFTNNFFISRLAVAFNANGAILIIGSFISPTVVAVYSLGDQIYRVLQTLVSSITLALYPHMSNTKNIKLMKRISLIFCLSLVIFSICIYFIIPFIISIIMDERLNFIIPVINVFILIFFINSVSAIFGYPFYAAIGRLDVVNRSLLLGSLFYLAILISLVYFDFNNPIIYTVALLVSELYVLCYRLIYFRLIMN